jgi:hypothetical protein
VARAADTWVARNGRRAAIAAPIASITTATPQRVALGLYCSTTAVPLTVTISMLPLAPTVS